MGTDLTVILRAEEEAERVVREAQDHAKQLLEDAQRLRELRLNALEPPVERAVPARKRPMNLGFLDNIAAKNRERAIKRILEAFDASA